MKALIKTLLTVGAISLAVPAYADITGSLHDVSASTGGDMCIACHVAHDSDPGAKGYDKLWNRDDSAETFIMYSSPTLDGAISASLENPSMKCASCHDGASAIQNYGGATGGTTFVTGAAVIGPDLSKEHPVSIDYVSADTGLHGTEPLTLPLYNGKVECGSCHESHNESGNASFLRILSPCVDCHNK